MRDIPFPTGFHGQFVKPFPGLLRAYGTKCSSEGVILPPVKFVVEISETFFSVRVGALIHNDLHSHGWSLPDCAHHNIGAD